MSSWLILKPEELKYESAVCRRCGGLKKNLHGRRLLWRLADEELMTWPDVSGKQRQSELRSVEALRESSGETADHLPPPSSRVADADFPSLPGWAQSLEVCGCVEEAELTNESGGGRS